MNNHTLFKQFMGEVMTHVQPDSPYWDTMKERFNKGVLYTLHYLDFNNRRKLLKILSNHFLTSKANS